ncbi:hypothetical protein [Clostridium saccharobutylicum]|uniref:hypothetical protein n=1 Tax=Clostridium saccharobutylicum TaxID=169679 RepID=UPI0004018B14|nr:hypothetical protein [Clostridium saccharobutylicum]MBA2904818.1 hypothetical protein [Clostridium saccharobutylicum]MBA8789395.1 hypothetical protein [Clostridium saccharobutylicum]MBA8896088.1 hypothetical protein [Clostridium saccharobutylicum]MBA8981235.1 hypothetical protein [Clostridium saccharobutylicum]MBA8993609.1 hypothetical protein [Clostridium saccharobutylicum]
MNKNVYDGLWMKLLKSKAISLDNENIALLQNIFKPKLLKKTHSFYKKVKNLLK